MQHFSLHKLRHYFASRLSAEGVPDADIMALGGWSTDAVMKTVYRHAMSAKTKEGKEAIARLLSDTISDTIS
jgi:integrase